MAFDKLQAPYEGLSKRAVEILHLLDDGLSDREIADRLVMTINTVKWYNRQIYSVLGVSSRTQAIARARELQLLHEDDEADSSPGMIYLVPKHNLPVETTRFIGRKSEIADGKRLLNTAHLLTLVGPPGTGKTRLALRIASEVKDSFRDGAYFVSLAPLNSPAAVIDAIASVIGVNKAPGKPIIETLKQALREKRMLLILDNFEHLLTAATQISELLSSAPHLKVLATSREPLHLYGEQEYAVPPLTLPDPTHLNPLALADCESTALFMQQARAVRPDFELTAENSRDIAQICVRLEGLPLAIELAAARVKLLTPPTLLARLTTRLDTLTGGAQDLPARQRTLRNTIEWSYNLLNEGERTLFARLAVMQGGCSLEAIEVICSDELPTDVFELLESLVNKSLIQQQESDETRFFMLETIHEYAWERLNASGEAQMMQRQHAEYFVLLAERAEPEFRRAGFTFWMRRLESEDSNLIAALDWALDDHDLELGVRLAVSLRDFWVMSGRFIEAEQWSQHALSKARTLSPEWQVRALTAAGVILYYASHHRALQKQLLQEAIKLAREVDDRISLGWSLVSLGVASIGQPAEYEEALTYAEEGLATFRELDFKPGIAQALNSMGEITRNHGDDERAQELYEECLRVVRETGEKRREAMSMNNLGCVMMRRGDTQRAEQLFRSALVKRLGVGYDRRGSLTNVLFLAGAIAANGDPKRAARLFGAVKALLEPMGVGLEPGDMSEYERDYNFVHSQLDDATFEACWNEGRKMSFEQMTAVATGEEA